MSKQQKTNKQPCPFCGSEFGKVWEGNRWGCTSNDCPEQPTIYSPCREGSTLNTPEKTQAKIDKFWDKVQRTAVEIKKEKQQKLKELTELVKKYYS